jgi:hypothetical protein
MMMQGSAESRGSEALWKKPSIIRFSLGMVDFLAATALNAKFFKNFGGQLRGQQSRSQKTQRALCFNTTFSAYGACL